MNDNIVNATITESLEKPDRKHVLDRLNDWQARVHALYDAVRQSLGDEYTYDRSGKQASDEELVQRAGIIPGEVPKLDILRIERNAELVAAFQPRNLWIIGANGRVDMIISPRSGGRRLFMLFDHSLPLSGPTDWRIVRPSDDPFKQPPFRPEGIRELLA
jgi:hypothetical protein